MDSILTSIKKLLGITEECTDFDLDIVMHINTVLTILNQIGVGEDDFSIVDDTATWSDFVGDNAKIVSLVKNYVYLKVRLLFDPPSSTVSEAVTKNLDEIEWRLDSEVNYLNGGS